MRQGDNSFCIERDGEEGIGRGREGEGEERP